MPTQFEIQRNSSRLVDSFEVMRGPVRIAKSEDEAWATAICAVLNDTPTPGLGKPREVSVHPKHDSLGNDIYYIHVGSMRVAECTDPEWAHHIRDLLEQRENSRAA